MAIVKCYECGADVSDNAMKCPKCGAMTKVDAKRLLSSYFWVSIPFMLIFFMLLFTHAPTIFIIIIGAVAWPCFLIGLASFRRTSVTPVAEIKEDVAKDKEDITQQAIDIVYADIASGKLKPETIFTKIAGVTFGKRQEYLQECWEGQEIIIKNKPSEKFPHSMAVYALGFDDKPTHMLGYINDDLAKHLFESAEESFNFDENMNPQYSGVISELTGGEEDKPIWGCNIEILI